MVMYSAAYLGKWCVVAVDTDDVNASEDTIAVTGGEGHLAERNARMIADALNGAAAAVSGASGDDRATDTRGDDAAPASDRALPLRGAFW